MWIEVDLIEFFIESSTKVGSSSKLMSVWFVLMFSPCFRSILIVIDNLLVYGCGEVSLKIIVEWFQSRLFGRNFYSAIFVERVVYRDQILVIIIGLLHYSESLGYSFFPLNLGIFT